MKKLFLILTIALLNVTLFSCTTDTDDQVFLEQMQLEESSTDGEAPILPPPPPEGNGGD
jgi:hypothetical protein